MKPHEREHAMPSRGRSRGSSSRHRTALVSDRARPLTGLGSRAVKIVVIVTISRVSHVDTLEGRAFESRGKCVVAIWIDQGDIPLRNSVTPAIPHISVR